MAVVNWSNVTDFANLPAAANTASSGTFWPGMLHMIWIIVFLVLVGYGFEVALIVSAFLGLVLSFFLVYAGLIKWGYIVEFAGILLFMFLYIIWSGRKDRA
jgi:hypothetical protein